MTKHLSSQDTLIREYHLGQKKPVKIMEEYAKAAKLPDPVYVISNVKTFTHCKYIPCCAALRVFRKYLD